VKWKWSKNKSLGNKFWRSLQCGWSFNGPRVCMPHNIQKRFINTIYYVVQTKIYSRWWNRNVAETFNILSSGLKLLESATMCMPWWNLGTHGRPKQLGRTVLGGEQFSAYESLSQDLIGSTLNVFSFLWSKNVGKNLDQFAFRASPRLIVRKCRNILSLLCSHIKMMYDIPQVPYKKWFCHLMPMFHKTGYTSLRNRDLFTLFVKVKARKDDADSNHATNPRCNLHQCG